MDERWIVHFEDPWLHIARSWTRHTIFKLRISRDEQGFKVAETWVNRDAEQYGGIDSLEDVERLVFVIDHIILGKPSE